MKFDANTAKAQEDFNVCLLGFNIYAKDTLLKMYQQGRFEGSNFCADVFDFMVATKESNFEKKNKGLLDDIKINFHNIKSFEEAVEKIGENINKYKLVIVALDDDGQTGANVKNLQKKIDKQGGSTTVIAAMLNEEDEEIKESPEKYPNIKTYGLTKNIFTSDAIINDSFISGGKYVNEYYNSTKCDPNKMKNWLAMTDFEKGSNLSVADFNYSFIKLIGKENFDKIASPEEFKKYLREHNELYNNLIKTEHLRWCAYLYSNGWTKLEVGNEILPENKDEKNKRHSCLVKFEELQKISEAFNEDYKKYDADNVDIIYEINKKLNEK